jgi:HK97 family phage portal protein
MMRLGFRRKDSEDSTSSPGPELRGLSLGGGNYNPFNNPSTPLSAVALDGYFDGPDISPQDAMAMPIFYRCVALLSGLGASCALNVYRAPGKELVTVQSLDRFNMDTTYTPFELWELILVHLLVWGNAYVVKVRDSSMRVVDLRPINPSLVDSVKIDPVSGQKVFAVKQPAANGTLKSVTFTTWEIMHIPGLGFDGVKGIGVVEYARQTLHTTQAADKLAARFYSRGTQLTGILKVKAPLSNQEQADAIRNRWQSKNAGLGHTAEVAVLDAETTFTPITIPPEQLQFLGSRLFQRGEIATWFGVPPFLVGDTEKTTSWGSGIEQMNTAFVAYTLQSWLKRCEQRVTREVVNMHGQVAEFALDHLLRGDTSERYSSYATAIQWGWMTRNEVRLKENMQTITGLDEPLQPMNDVMGGAAIDPATGQIVPGKPKADLNPPFVAQTKPGSGKSAAATEDLD